MNIEEIRNIIRNVIEGSTNTLNEISLIKDEPSYYEFHKDHNQYIFKTNNDNVYVLSIKRSCLFLEDQEILKSYTDKEENKKCYDFLMVNFFPYEKDPNLTNSFDDKTNKNESITIIKNFTWLLDDYMNNHPNEKCFAFSAEPQRMRLYNLAVNTNFNDSFTIYPPKKYDKSFSYDLMIMIKK